VDSQTLPASKTTTTTTTIIQCSLTLEDSLSKCKCQFQAAIPSKTAIPLCQILATMEHHNNPNHKVYLELALLLRNYPNNLISLEGNLRRLDYLVELVKVLVHNLHRIVPMQEKKMEKTELDDDDVFLTTEFIESSFFDVLLCLLDCAIKEVLAL